MFMGKEVTPVEKHYILLMNSVVFETALQPVKARNSFLQSGTRPSYVLLQKGQMLMECYGRSKETCFLLYAEFYR